MLLDFLLLVFDVYSRKGNRAVEDRDTEVWGMLGILNMYLCLFCSHALAALCIFGLSLYVYLGIFFHSFCMAIIQFKTSLIIFDRISGLACSITCVIHMSGIMESVIMMTRLMIQTFLGSIGGMMTLQSCKK